MINVNGFDMVMNGIGMNIKSKHESKLYKLITDISEDLRDNKGYSEAEIKVFLIEQILEIISES